MAQRIVTNNKNDIITGFDIELSFAPFTFLRQVFDQKYSKLKVPDEAVHTLAQEACRQVLDGVNDLINQAEEIFIEEASLSRWSGNMIDNSVCGISGKMPTLSNNGEQVDVDLKIGVNHKEITNRANWKARQAYRKDNRNPSGVVYEYNGYRMHPNVDYSIYLENGTARRSPNASLWAGFVERAEERFEAL